MMKNTNSFIIKYIFIFITSNLVSCNNNNCTNPAAEMICSCTEVVKKYLDEDFMIIEEMDDQVFVLEQLTGIKCDLDGSTLGFKIPSLQNYSDWNDWLKEHGLKCPR